VTDPVPSAAGLRQALAATELFYGTDFTKIDKLDLVEALEGKTTSAIAFQPDIPSMVVRIDKTTIIGQRLEVLVTASGLPLSKGQSASSVTPVPS
jgi:tyrosyl-tRNA synthetase